MSKWLPLSRQMVNYGIVGVGQIVIDWLVFVYASQFGVVAGIANIIGRICGAAVGFWLNGRWTFSEHSTRLGFRHLLRYAASWSFMTAMSTVIVLLVDHSHGLKWTWIVKPFADTALAFFGFVISKYWIYHHPQQLSIKEPGSEMP
jgi:putative flippase GtrA